LFKEKLANMKINNLGGVTLGYKIWNDVKMR
jgi:hypothetical protein